MSQGEGKLSPKDEDGDAKGLQSTGLSLWQDQGWSTSPHLQGVIHHSPSIGKLPLALIPPFSGPQFPHSQDENVVLYTLH